MARNKTRKIRETSEGRMDDDVNGPARFGRVASDLSFAESPDMDWAAKIPARVFKPKALGRENKKGAR